MGKYRISLCITLGLCLFPIVCKSPSKQVSPPIEDTVHAVVFHEVSAEHLDGPVVSPDYFRDVLRMIQIGGGETVTAGEIVRMLRQGHIPQPNLVALMFDDGWGSDYAVAYPILREMKMKATAFVFTSGTEQGQPRRCSWDNLKEMQDSGVWEVHGHTLTHPNLLQIDDTQLKTELETPFQQLKEHRFGEDIFMAYPNGGRDDRVEKATQAAGYAAGFTVGPCGEIRADSPLFRIPRTTVAQLFDQDLVCRKLGLHKKEIQRQLRIIDEDEGIFEGEWQTVCSKEPMGMYGDSCRYTRNPQAGWQCSLPAAEEGTYRISVWTPASKATGCDPSAGINLNLSDTEGNESTQIPNFRRRENGWTEVCIRHLNPRTYTLRILPYHNGEATFILDAVKVEKVSESP